MARVPTILLSVLLLAPDTAPAASIPGTSAFADLAMSGMKELLMPKIRPSAATFT